ncbi:hypothetical protein LCGC14_1060700 [marine sediment metagenome]|uniref:Uncharacterized protein n=1 Tax=marine sediment metagenome TaxID=412755 RepID=A0A0F9N862_9ZZZZ|nr:hypothetical protein [Candidatus Aminicenantes bacterium]
MLKEHQFRGNKIELVNDGWVFSTSGEPVEDSWKETPCGICGEKSTEEGHDKCIGTLPGVMNACCGHGQIDEAYVVFSDERILRGGNALDVISKLKGRKDNA